MATITAVETRIKEFGNEAFIYTWTALTTTDNYGSPTKLPGWSDRCVQMNGALGTGGQVTMYGSNVVSPNLANDDDWFILNDAQGNALTLDTLRGEQIIEVPLWIRPKISGGNGATDLNIHLCLVKGGVW